MVQLLTATQRRDLSLAGFSQF